MSEQSRSTGPAASRPRHRVARGAPSYRPVRSPLLSMGPSLLEEQRRTRAWRRTILGVLGVALAVAATVWSVLTLGQEVVTEPARSAMRAPALPLGAPEPLALAHVPAEGLERPLRLQLPVRRAGITAIGYSHRADGTLLALDPEGTRSNPPFVQRILGRFLATEQASQLRWYELSDSGEHNVVTVGGVPGTDVYAPLAATVVAISDNVSDGETHGVVVQLQPLGDGETIVAVRGIDPDPGLAVGNTVSEGITRLGYVRALPEGTRSPLGRYSHDDGAGVELSVRQVQGEAL